MIYSRSSTWSVLFVLVSTCLVSGCQWIRALGQPPSPAEPSSASPPAGPRVYVTDRDSRVIALRTDDNTVAEQFPVEQGAGYSVISPDNLTLYATAKEKDYVRVFQTTGLPLPRIQTDKGPFGIDITRDGKRAIVTNKGANTLSVLDLNVPQHEIRRIGTGHEPTIVVMAPDDRRFYVLLHKDNAVAAYDTSTYEEVRRADVGTDPFGLAIDPDGRYLYTSSFDRNEVIVLYAETLAEAKRLKVGDGPYEVLAARDGEIYVSCVEDGSVVHFKRDDWNADNRAVHVGSRPYGLALSPDERMLYVALEGEARLDVLSLPGLDEKTRLDLGLMPVDVFTGR